MSNAEEILALRREYETLLHTDAEFSARTKLTSSVLEELEKMGRLEPSRDHGFAAFIVVAALEKAMPVAAENTRLRALILDADSMLQERAVTLDGTAKRMGEQAMLPKSQREDDFDRDDMLRYHAYAAECQSVLGRFRSIIAGQG